MEEIERPDLSDLPPDIAAYIKMLEEELAELRSDTEFEGKEESDPAEPPTSLNVITVSQLGQAKRTPRHYYGRQRRGGMGVFDLQTAQDPPAHLLVVEEEEFLLVFTDHGRAFRLPVTALPATEVRARGISLTEKLPFRPGEQIAALLPASGGAYVALVSERGWVRRARASFFGRSLIPGISVHDPDQGGPLAAACWTEGSEELFVVTRQGQAIRFLETQISGRAGRLGLRVAQDDAVVAIAAVTEEGGVFLAGADGKGTVRLMSGFRVNKAPGASGKTAIKSESVVGAARVRENDDIFLISELGKIIRFAADEVPAKEGVVQGVNCIGLRADEATAVAVSPRMVVSSS